MAKSGIEPSSEDTCDVSGSLERVGSGKFKHLEWTPLLTGARTELQGAAGHQVTSGVSLRTYLQFGRVQVCDGGGGRRGQNSVYYLAESLILISNSYLMNKMIYKWSDGLEGLRHSPLCCPK